jgi:hypothetical protein
MSWTKRHPRLFAFIALFLFFALLDLLLASRESKPVLPWDRPTATYGEPK